jgi:flagellar biosynthesis chaperone FliJ
MSEQEVKKRKELSDKIEIALKKIYEGDPNAAEELYELLREYNDFRDSLK